MGKKLKKLIKILKNSYPKQIVGISAILI